MPTVDELTAEIGAITLPEKLVNRGAGAGCANTNKTGKAYEKKVSSEDRLINQGFIKTAINLKNKNSYYLTKTLDDRTITFASQDAFRTYMKNKYDAEMFRKPDEAFIIEYNTGRKVVKILEIKNQNKPGSVDLKLWAGPSMKREYEIVLGDSFEVCYGFCVSSWLQTQMTTEKKYTALRIIFKESGIACLFGDDKDYAETFDSWLSADDYSI